MILRTAALLLAALAAAAPLAAQDAADISARTDARGAAPNISGLLTLTITAPNGDQRVISADSYQKERGEEREDRLFVFTHPPNVRGMALLVHSYMEQGDDSMWIYLPAMDRIKRVDLGSSGGGYFLGSDFTFRDMVSRDQTEYEHALLPAGLRRTLRCRTACRGEQQNQDGDGKHQHGYRQVDGGQHACRHVTGPEHGLRGKHHARAGDRGQQRQPSDREGPSRP